MLLPREQPPHPRLSSKAQEDQNCIKSDSQGSYHTSSLDTRSMSSNGNNHSVTSYFYSSKQDSQDISPLISSRKASASININRKRS